MNEEQEEALRINDMQRAKEMLEGDTDFDEFYDFLQEKDFGNWDDVNGTDTIQQYVSEKMKEGIQASHILEAMETNRSEHCLYQIWLGNSMETPTPINNKKDLVEALGLKGDFYGNN